MTVEKSERERHLIEPLHQWHGAKAVWMEHSWITRVPFLALVWLLLLSISLVPVHYTSDHLSFSVEYSLNNSFRLVVLFEFSTHTYYTTHAQTHMHTHTDLRNVKYQDESCYCLYWCLGVWCNWENAVSITLRGRPLSNKAGDCTANKNLYLQSWVPCMTVYHFFYRFYF